MDQNRRSRTKNSCSGENTSAKNRSDTQEDRRRNSTEGFQPWSFVGFACLAPAWRRERLVLRDAAAQRLHQAFSGEAPLPVTAAIYARQNGFPVSYAASLGLIPASRSSYLVMRASSSRCCDRRRHSLIWR